MTTRRTRGKASPKLGQPDLRTSIPLKLRPGEDDDLVRWYNELPKGKRQEVLRQALRAGIGKVTMNGHAEMERIEATTKAIWAAMNDLPSYLDGLMQRLAVSGVQIAPPVEAEATPRVDAGELERRASRLKKAIW